MRERVKFLKSSAHVELYKAAQQLDIFTNYRDISHEHFLDLSHSQGELHQLKTSPAYIKGLKLQAIIEHPIFRYLNRLLIRPSRIFYHLLVKVISAGPEVIYKSASFKLNIEDTKTLLSLSPVTLRIKSQSKTTILILASNSHNFIRCLESLNNTKQATHVNICALVELNVLSAKTKELLGYINFYDYDPNLNIVANLNQTLIKIKSKNIVFVFDELVFAENWFEPLINRLEEKNTAIATSKIVAKGSDFVLDAGTIINKDGTITTYGGEGWSNSFEYDYYRQIDCSSKYLVAISKAKINDSQILDSSYDSLDFAFADLSFKLLSKNLKTVFESTSTANIDRQYFEDTKFAKFTLTDKKFFLNKHAQTLNKTYSNRQSSIWIDRDRTNKKMVLMIDDVIPSEDKGSARMRRLLDVVISLGYKITFWPHWWQEDRAYYDNVKKLQALGVEVVTEKNDFQTFSRNRGKFYDLVIVCRPWSGMSYLNTLLSHYPNAKFIYDTESLHYIRADRQAKLQQEVRLKLEAKNYKKVELNLMKIYDATIVVSDKEKEILKKTAPGVEVATVSNIHSQKRQNSIKSYRNRVGILTIANFRFGANIDSLNWFVREIMPLVNKIKPDIELTVIGSNMGLEVKQLASKNVKIAGYVKNVSRYFNKTRIFVAPVRIGAGVKVKIGQALEYNVPIVTTTVGAEGAHLKNGSNVLIANDVRSFAERILKLYNDPELWETLVKNSYGVIDQYFSADVARENLLALLNKLNSE